MIYLVAFDQGLTCLYFYYLLLLTVLLNVVQTVTQQVRHPLDVTHNTHNRRIWTSVNRPARYWDVRNNKHHNYRTLTTVQLLIVQSINNLGKYLTVCTYDIPSRDQFQLVSSIFRPVL